MLARRIFIYLASVAISSMIFAIVIGGIYGDNVGLLGDVAQFVIVNMTQVYHFMLATFGGVIEEENPPPPVPASPTSAIDEMATTTVVAQDTVEPPTPDTEPLDTYSELIKYGVENPDGSVIMIDGTVYDAEYVDKHRAQPIVVINGKQEYYTYETNGTKYSTYHFYAKAPPCSANVNSQGTETREMFGFTTGMPRTNPIYGNSPDWLRIWDVNEAVAMGFAPLPCKHDKNGNGLGDGWEDHDKDGYADGFAKQSKEKQCMKPYGWLDGWWIRATSMQCTYGEPGTPEAIKARQLEIQQIQNTYPGTIPDAFDPKLMQRMQYIEELRAEKEDKQQQNDAPKEQEQEEQEPVKVPPPTEKPTTAEPSTTLPLPPPTQSPPPTTTAPSATPPPVPITTTPISRAISYDTATTGTIVRIINPDTIQLDQDIKIKLTLLSVPERGDTQYNNAMSYVRNTCPAGTSIIYDIDSGAMKGSQGSEYLVALAWCTGYGNNNKQGGDSVPINELLAAKGYGEIDKHKCRSSEFSDDKWAQRAGC